MSLSILTRSEEDATVVDVTGAVTLRNVPDFLHALMSLLKTKTPARLLLNMTNVSYIDSAGVACLVEVLKVSRDLKLGFALFGIGPEAKDVLELTRLLNVFDIYDTEKDALLGVRPASSGAAG
jgi:anti-sigma B factor antagonist